LKILGSIIGISKIILLISEGMNILIFNYSYLNDMNSDVNIHYKKQYLNRSISCYNNSMMKLKDKGRLTVILNQNNFYKKNIENQKIGQFKNNYVSGEINLMNENDNNNSKNKNKMAKREYYILESYKFLWIPKKR
jgi:hypothetical protein